MLIVIGADGNSPESAVAKRFGHAEYFITYNSDKNDFIAEANYDPGHNHSNLGDFVDKGVKAFIVGNIGPHAFGILTDGGCEVYLARKMTIRESVNKFLEGGLERLDKPTAKQSINHGDHGHGRHQHH